MIVGAIVIGRVTAARGGPVIGARVAAGAMVGISGEDGAYRLALPAGTFEICASHAGFADERRDLEITPAAPGVATTESFDFVLMPGGSVRGVVISRDRGEPLSGAIVDARLVDGGRDVIATAVTAADGTFALGGVRTGAIALAARARGHASAPATTVEVAGGEVVDGVRVLVDRAFAIRGRVVRGAVPVCGALVVGYAMPGLTKIGAVDASGGDGSFAIEGLQPGEYRLLVRGGGLFDANRGNNVHVVDRDIDDVAVAVASTVTISGRVEPPAAATISLEARDASPAWWDEVRALATGTDPASGRFELRGVPPLHYDIIARAASGDSGSLAVTVVDTDRADLVIPLVAGATISGCVVDSNGAPVAGASVGAHRGKEWRARARDRAITGADGEFTIASVRAGSVRVQVDDVYDGEHIELASGSSHAGLALTVPARDGAIHGRVEEPDGGAAAEVRVTLHHELVGVPSPYRARPVLTADDGAFAFERLSEAAYTLVAEGLRGRTRAQLAHVKPGATPVLRLLATGSIVGRVTADNTPVSTFAVHCQSADFTYRASRASAADDGAFVFDHLPPGRYACEADIDGATAHATVDVTEGAVARVELALGAWASISGTVVDALTRQPIAAQPTVRSGIRNCHGRTDGQGRFLVHKVPASEGDVLIMDGGYIVLAQRGYRVAAGDNLDLGTIAVLPPHVDDRGTLGMTVDDGLVVTAIEPEGSAARAGIHVGDLIISIDGVAVTPPLVFEPDTTAADHTYQLGISRGDLVLAVAVTAIAAPLTGDEEFRWARART